MNQNERPLTRRGKALRNNYLNRGTDIELLSSFYALCSGDSELPGFLISAEVSFDKILDQLTSRKSYIEKRLIEVDTDTESERNRLRGELTGIDYAINVIMTNQ